MSQMETCNKSELFIIRVVRIAALFLMIAMRASGHLFPFII
jgi:hypothetical protein